MLFGIVKRDAGEVEFTDGTIVRVNRDYDTGFKFFEAWEIDHGHNHSALSYFDHVRYGTIPTRRLPEDLDALP